jgi:hypothetical protein
LIAEAGVAWLVAETLDLVAGNGSAGQSLKSISMQSPMKSPTV